MTDLEKKVDTKMKNRRRKPIRDPRFVSKLPKWVDTLMALIVFLMGILDSLSREFNWMDFLGDFSLSVFASLIIYILLFLLRYNKDFFS